MPLLKCDHVTKRFGGLVAVDDMTFTIDHGEMMAIVGPNGAGKTTMFNLINGVFPADEGTIEFEGVDVTHFPAYKRAHLGMGRTFQIPRPFSSATVQENIAIGAMFGAAGSEVTVDEAMEMADRIVVMNRGVIEQVGRAAELYNHPANRFVAEFIGRMNVLHLAAGADGKPSLAGTTLHAENISTDGPWVVGVRPEHIQLVRDCGDSANLITGTIERGVFLGNVTRITLNLDGQKLVVEVQGELQIPPRDVPLTVRIPPDAVKPLGRAEI